MLDVCTSGIVAAKAELGTVTPKPELCTKLAGGMGGGGGVGRAGGMGGGGGMAGAGGMGQALVKM
jgi:hypothetical protein